MIRAMIIGLTGSMGCGKGETVNILQKYNFKYITLSSMVREEARRRGVAEEREKLMEIGNDIRSKEGVGALAARALKKISEAGDGNWVVDGIRNPAEIIELRKSSDTHIISFRVPTDILVKRIILRGRESDSKNEEQLIASIERELGKGEPENGQHVAKCISLADVLIDNEGTLADLEKKIDYFYATVKSGARMANPQKINRPSKDEYYLDLARSVCRRGTCLKVEIGAVIIRDDQVVATGYCGASRGTKSSQAHGFCLRKHLGIPSGQRYEMCRSVHAEQNAIINAARSGTSLLNGDMYIYGKTFGLDGKPIDAFPCFICKKMLINCGLKRIICSLKDGGSQTFTIEEWMDEWTRNDIIDDKFQYGVPTPAISR